MNREFADGRHGALEAQSASTAHSPRQCGNEWLMFQFRNTVR